MLNGIKNLVFDLGNVIIDLDIDRTFVQLGHWMGDEYLKGVPMGVFESFEVGAISEEEFFGALRGATPHAVGVHRFRDAWNAMLLSIPFGRLEMLERLNERYRVFLLSNTNVTHLRWVHGYLDVVYGVRDFESRFFHGFF